jgi:hypothetical protein
LRWLFDKYGGFLTNISKQTVLVINAALIELRLVIRDNTDVLLVDVDIHLRHIIYTLETIPVFIVIHLVYILITDRALLEFSLNYMIHPSFSTLINLIVLLLWSDLKTSMVKILHKEFELAFYVFEIKSYSFELVIEVVFYLVANGSATDILS